MLHFERAQPPQQQLCRRFRGSLDFCLLCILRECGGWVAFNDLAAYCASILLDARPHNLLRLRPS